MSEVAFWFIDELARGVRTSDVRPEGPLPLTILLAILEIPIHSIVFDTVIYTIIANEALIIVLNSDEEFARTYFSVVETKIPNCH